MKAQNEKQVELENEIYALKVQIECLEGHCTALEEDNINLGSLCAEIESLKAEIERLKGMNTKLLQEKEYLKSNNERFANNMRNVLEIERQQAVKEFAEWIKDNITDIPFCNQKAYNIFCDMLNEKLKEYER